MYGLSIGDKSGDLAFADTAYAPYHVTYALCVGAANFSHSKHSLFEIADPDLPIHLSTCMAVQLI